jgi:hypothetical protein
MIYKTRPKRRVLPYPNKEKRRMENYFRILAGILRVFNHAIRTDQYPNIILEPYQQYTPKISGRFCGRLFRRHSYLFENEKKAHQTRHSNIRSLKKGRYKN